MQRAKTKVMIPNQEIGFVSPKSPPGVAEQG
jgi:hypothetical protein